MLTNGFGRAYNSINVDLHASASPSHSGRRAETQVQALEARVDRLAMLCEAMWTLLRDNTAFTDEQLLDRITEIDLEDGKLDNQVKRSTAIECHNCGRTIARRMAKCMYCGTLAATDPFA